MKLKSATLRTFTTLHTWVGLVAGFALFVAFYAGAITVFHDALPVWQSARTAGAAPQTLDDAQRLLDGVLEAHPTAREHVGMLFPSAKIPQAVIYWQDEKSVWQYATLGNLQGQPQPPHAGLYELINQLHYSLGLPLAGTYLMGFVSLLYGLALVSGVVIHLPKLAKDLFALRPGRNLKRFWQDAHNLIGVLSLPLHVMFAITGTLLCLMFVLMAALNPLVFDGKLMAALGPALDTAPTREAAHVAASPGSLALWRERAIDAAHRAGLASFEPAYLKLAHAGDRQAVVEITGASPRALAPLGAIALDATSGEVLAMQLPGQRDANHASLAAAYAMHFGDYDSTLVQWLYFLLGLGGAFLFYSGNLLWIESRRKRRQAEQGRAQVYMAKATIGACIGLCVAVSAAFVAAQVGEALVPEAADDLIRWACFGAWGSCALWAALRVPARGAIELLWVAALVTLAIPIAHGAVTGIWIWRSAAARDAALFWVDAVALGMVVVFGAFARATTKRVIHGEANSVWTLVAFDSLLPTGEGGTK